MPATNLPRWVRSVYCHVDRWVRLLVTAGDMSRFLVCFLTTASFSFGFEGCGISTPETSPHFRLVGAGEAKRSHCATPPCL